MLQGFLLILPFFFSPYFSFLTLKLFILLSFALIQPALIITCLLEFLQLWQPPFLLWVRSSWAGRMVFGNVFSWVDFPYYFVGSGLGWLWLRLIIRGAKLR
ncbi:DUF2809 domain-containing protein [Nostoc sp. MS1]|uniref:ribosomal maturation YjgA family protein n=1 Tax=Nostoc sp. MS1 TaxID=2764711 RepID=UPI001CC7E2B0|nr:DUF2809 domain-containing protein [Nostoc sp. MS1]